jgi:hypothetical protein
MNGGIVIAPQAIKYAHRHLLTNKAGNFIEIKRNYYFHCKAAIQTVGGSARLSFYMAK